MGVLTLYYDEACPRCTRWAKKLKKIGKEQIHLLPLRSKGLSEDDIDPYRSLQAIPARTDKGRILYGFDVLQAVVSKIWWLWLIWPLTFLLQKSGLGRYLYHYFASKRRVSCSTNCLKSS